MEHLLIALIYLAPLFAVLAIGGWAVERYNTKQRRK